MEKERYTMVRLQKAVLQRHEEEARDPDAFDYRDWALAVCGPTGYIAHLCNREKHGDDIAHGEIFDEIADAMIYLTLLCASLGGSIGEVVARKFNQNSKEMDSLVTLPADNE